MAERNFDAERNGSSQEGHSFTIGGKTFRTKPTIPPSFFVDEERKEGASFVIEFIKKMVVAEDREEFIRLLDGDDVFVELKDLINISNWLLEVVSKRPTQEPQPSSAGLATTSDTSAETESEEATTGGN